MKTVKRFFSILIFLIFTLPIFAQNELALLEVAKKNGMTLYWDSLSESGIIEKNGHQISFRKDEKIILFDSIRLLITDAPSVENSEIFVSKQFLRLLRVRA